MMKYFQIQYVRKKNNRKIKKKRWPEEKSYYLIITVQIRTYFERNEQ